MKNLCLRSLVLLVGLWTLAGPAKAVAQHYYAPTRARFVFDSEPQGAAVSVDGKPCGVTPLTVELTYRLWSANLSKTWQEMTRAEWDAIARNSTCFEVVVRLEGYDDVRMNWTADDYIFDKELRCRLRPKAEARPAESQPGGSPSAADGRIR